MADNQTPPAATDYSGVREYVGARYVPVFANPAEWDNTRGYEPLTIVLYQGNSYTSTQYVPTGIDIKNTQFWLNTGNYNAQVEAYRKEVLAFDGRITDNAEAIETTNNNLTSTASSLQNNIISVSNALQTEVQTRETEDQKLATRITALETEKDEVLLCFGDSWGKADYSDPTLWPDNLKALCCVGVMKNYCVNGAGFVVANNTIQMQVNSAINDNSYDHNMVKYIGIVAGVNDGTNAIGTTASTVVNNLKTAFPNAKIGVMCNAGVTEAKDSARLGKRATFLAQNTYNSQGTFSSGVVIALIDGMLKSDNLHLTSRGGKLCAHCIFNTIMGNSEHSFIGNADVAATYNLSTPDLRLRIRKGLIYWNVILAAGSSGTIKCTGTYPLSPLIGQALVSTQGDVMGFTNVDDNYLVCQMIGSKVSLNRAAYGGSYCPVF